MAAASAGDVADCLETSIATGVRHRGKRARSGTSREMASCSVRDRAGPLSASARICATKAEIAGGSWPQPPTRPAGAAPPDEDAGAENDRLAATARTRAEVTYLPIMSLPAAPGLPEARRKKPTQGLLNIG